MIQGTCIEIHTKKFPILLGEDDEIVNDGMYGKALCQYLGNELPKHKIQIPYSGNEDWGWLIRAKTNDFTLDLQIYSDSESGQNPEKYAIMSSVTEQKKWSWKKFKKIEVESEVLYIMDTIEKIFSK